MLKPLVLIEKQKLLPCPEYWKRLELYIDGEDWLPIEGYFGFYEISSFGRVKSKFREIYRVKVGLLTVKEKILKQGIAKKRKGYLMVKLSNGLNGSSFWVHRLVGTAYIDNPLNKKTINHKRGNVKDNRVTELEWNTYLENDQHSRLVLLNKCKLPHPKGAGSYQSKKVVCINNGIEYESIRDAANNLKCVFSSVSQVCNGLRNHTHGYKFKFV